MVVPTSTSVPDSRNTENPAPSDNGIESFNAAQMMDLLPNYYSRLFPANLMYRWLSYGSDELFSCREFSFTLPGDVYIRYQAFTNENDFARELVRKLPEKIDIGAIFNVSPKQRITSEFFPVQKEFVVDIDLTDYDDVRTCCDGAKVCEKCWKFIAVAVEILDRALREDFGFRHLLWVFSGRRGVHCWVCDEVARNLDNTGRGAVIEYLHVIKGGENQIKKVKLYEKIHPSISAALETIEQHFDNILEEQDFFHDDKIIEILPDDMKGKVKNEKGSQNRWNSIRKLVNDKKGKVVRILEEIQLQYVYPRLDINVSKGLNHLLKSPFVIHPKTGKVCVPFDPKQVFQFDINKVPSITQLLDEIGLFDAAKSNETGKADYKKTSLAPFMKTFENFVKALEASRKKIKSEPGAGAGTDLDIESLVPAN